MQIFIMCQGEQRRLKSLGYPKQLIPLNGVPLLQRTIRLVRDLELDSRIVVIGREDLAPGCFGANRIPLQDPGFCILDGMAQTEPWLDQNIVVFLLGDVIWSKAALTTFLTDPRQTVFAGTPTLTPSQGEVFGCKFADQALLKDLLATAPCRFRESVPPREGGVRHRIQYEKQQGGHLRRLLWHWTAKSQGLTSGYLEINDWTDDIDEEADLKRIPEFERLVENGRND
jgi:molybdopterin-guanine dinucleotide biosynthesis protein A